MARKIVKGRVTPCFVHPGFVPVDFMKALDLSAHANMNQTTFFAASDARIINARTHVVKAFLEQSDAEWAWFIDTDSIMQADALPRLLKTAQLKKAKVVAGLVMILNKTEGLIYPNIFFEHNPGNRVPGEGRYKHAYNIPDEPFEVDGTGGACLLVHREVLEKVGEMNAHDAYPWQNELMDPNTGKYEGEDLVFCQRVKAAGYSIWYDPQVQIAHLKETFIGMKEYNAFVQKNKDRLKLVS